MHVSPMNWFWIILASAVPIFLWIQFFDWQHHEKRKFVFLSLLAGMLSILPIKLYEKYWSLSFFKIEHLNLFDHITTLTNEPLVTQLIAFVMTSVIVSLMLFLFCAAIMSLVEIGSGDNSWRIFRQKFIKILEAPFFFVTAGVIVGLAAFEFSQVFPYHVWFFLIVGMLEEFVKHVLVRFADDEKIVSIADAVTFSIIVALGFSFAENAIYFYNFMNSDIVNGNNWIGFFVLRSILPVLAHVGFSAILGYYFGLSKFASDITDEKIKAHRLLWLRIVNRFTGLNIKVAYHDEKMMEGLLLAMILHAAFNYFLEMQQLLPAFILVAALFAWVVRVLHQHQCLKLHRNGYRGVKSARPKDKEVSIHVYS